jgi:hypothetical protein
VGITGQREERYDVGRPGGTLKAILLHHVPTLLMTRLVYSSTRLKLIVLHSVQASSGSSYFVGHTYES